MPKLHEASYKLFEKHTGGTIAAIFELGVAYRIDCGKTGAVVMMDVKEYERLKAAAGEEF